MWHMKTALYAEDFHKNKAFTETEILNSYDKVLKRKLSVHFAYPYNLSYDHVELYDFMMYSIHN